MNCRFATLLLAVVILAAGCGTAARSASLTRSQATGTASWYGEPFHGRRTANGEVYDKNALTAAHRTLEFGTWVRVTNTETGASVDVRINDHFPGTKGRAIDLSEASFARIAPLEQGLARVRLQVLERPD